MDLLACLLVRSRSRWSNGQDCCGWYSIENLRVEKQNINYFTVKPYKKALLRVCHALMNVQGSKRIIIFDTLTQSCPSCLRVF